MPRPSVVLLYVLGEAARAANAEAERHQYCVIGAGPAGLQLGFFLQNAQRDYVILERTGSAGSFYRKHPRHRTLISINKRYTGHERDLPPRTAEFNRRHDWNSLINDESVGGKSLLFTSYSEEYLPPADDLVRYLEDFAEFYSLNVHYNENVSQVHRPSQPDSPEFPLALRTSSSISAADTAYQCGVVVVATGLHVPNVPDFRGGELLQHYDGMSVDPRDFRGKSILIIGNGNSAFETASNLLPVANYIHIVGRSAARFSYQTHYVGDVRLTSLAGSVVESYQLKSLVGFAEKKHLDLPEKLIKFVQDESDGRVRIEMLDMVWCCSAGNTRCCKNRAQSTIYPLDRAYDAVLLCAGFKFDPSLFAEGAAPRMQRLGQAAATTNEDEHQGGFVSGKYPELSGAYESNQPGVYFAGTLAHGKDWRNATGGVIHGFRYTAQSLFHILEKRLHRVTWPSVEMPFHVGKALGRAYARINEASSLTAMYGQLVDVIAFPPVDADVLSQPGVQMRYYDAVPVGFIKELLATSDGAPPVPYMTIGFEYGPKDPGPERVSSNDPARDVFREHRTPPRCVTQDCFEQVLPSLSCASNLLAYNKY